MIKGSSGWEGIEKSLKKQFTWKLNATRWAQSQAKPWRNPVKQRKRKRTEKNERKPKPNVEVWGVERMKEKKGEKLKKENGGPSLMSWTWPTINNKVLDVWPTTNKLLVQFVLSQATSLFKCYRLVCFWENIYIYIYIYIYISILANKKLVEIEVDC